MSAGAASIDRRAFLGSVAGGTLGFAALQLAESRGGPGDLWVGCRKTKTGDYEAAAIDGVGTDRFRVALPDRGHACAFDPTGRTCVVFARRPGRFAVVIDVERGVAERRFDAGPGRHFYGHGVFSPDGRHLLTSENDYERGVGVLGIRDARDAYRQIGELPSHGIGPHDVRLGADGGTLLVANGGILTHPDYDRIKLNLDSMAPSLVIAELASGRPLDVRRLPEAMHRLSIRHLALGRQKRTIMALQDEADGAPLRSLVALADDAGLRLLPIPPETLARMRRYTGSAAFDASGRYAAVSAPRGGLVVFFDTQSVPERAYLRHLDLADGSGVAADGAPGGFVLTSGTGAVVRYDARSGARQVLAAAASAAAWDNHLVRARPTASAPA